ncbi:hypothetical protein CYMTET_26445 [Cymbomonas tetramitiformis]|uniref:Uncharacterized protein n=1 Tax=Cymbomonas tetramitiformis TaxID=36881 RepID=A0AAE0FRT2_9CHLO|nr:hypothetical protein CYMTET_26445 [Cymbomonas tetramitiformis]
MKRKGNNQSILKTCRGRKPQQSDYRDLAEVKLAETEVGKVEMDLAEVGKVEVDLADLGKVEVGKVEVDLAEVDLAEVGKVEVGKVEVDLAEVVKKYPCKLQCQQLAAVKLVEVDVAEVDFAEVDVVKVETMLPVGPTKTGKYLLLGFSSRTKAVPCVKLFRHMQHALLHIAHSAL